MQAASELAKSLVTVNKQLAADLESSRSRVVELEAKVAAQAVSPAASPATAAAADQTAAGAPSSTSATPTDQENKAQAQLQRQLQRQHRLLAVLEKNLATAEIKLAEANRLNDTLVSRSLQAGWPPVGGAGDLPAAAPDETQQAAAVTRALAQLAAVETQKDKARARDGAGEGPERYLHLLRGTAHCHAPPGGRGGACSRETPAPIPRHSLASRGGSQ